MAHEHEWTRDAEHAFPWCACGRQVIPLEPREVVYSAGLRMRWDCGCTAACEVLPTDPPWALQPFDPPCWTAARPIPHPWATKGWLEWPEWPALA